MKTFDWYNSIYDSCTDGYYIMRIAAVQFVENNIPCIRDFSRDTLLLYAKFEKMFNFFFLIFVCHFFGNMKFSNSKQYWIFHDVNLIAKKRKLIMARITGHTIDV